MNFEEGLEKIEKDRIFEHKHNCKIKERLKKYRDNLNPRPTYKTLMAELEKNFNSELKVSYGTLHDVFEKKTINGDGKVESVDELGKKKLAYEIQKNTEGNYVVLNFEANPSIVAELERVYRITDEVMKFITIRKDEE